jgi:hypothetical protein
MYPTGNTFWKYVLALKTFRNKHTLNILGKSKSIPVRGRGGPWGCETSRFPHYLDNQLTDGGEFVSLKRRPIFTIKKIPDTHSC